MNYTPPYYKKCEKKSFFLVPDKFVPDFWPKYTVKKIFSRDFYPILSYIKNYVEKLLNFPNNWYIIKIYSKYLAKLLILYIQIAS